MAGRLPFGGQYTSSWIAMTLAIHGLLYMATRWNRPAIWTRAINWK